MDGLLAGDGADHIVMLAASQLTPAHDPEKWVPVFGKDHAPINRTNPMTIRTRKLIGTVALLLLVSVWGLLAMALAQSVLTDISGFVAAIYYVVAGLGWVLPALPLI